MVGCGGRMGRLLLREIIGDAGLTLSGGVDGAPAGDLGLLAGLPALGRAAVSDVASILSESDVLIDFSTPAATAALAPQAAAAGVALVIGTTGLDEPQLDEVRAASARVPIVMAANYSVGVNLLLSLVEQAARTLGPGYDIEIVEMHHRRKVDAPSGTALALGHAAAAGRGQTLDTLRLPARDGITGARPAGGIGFAALRGGDVAGDHSVMFATDGELVTLSHRASDRRVFAEGAIRAARWVPGRPSGLYGMADIIGAGTS